MFEDLMINIKVNKDGVRDGINDVGKSLKGLKGAMAGINQIIGVGQMYMLADGLAKCVKSTLDMTETVNMFNVAMGENAVVANEFLKNISNATGMDLTNLQQATANYGMLARSMGLTSEQALTLSTNTTQLAVDLSSMFNVPIQQVMDDLRSGLLGQSETVYKYGVDVTEASLETERMAQGIQTSVRNMSQGEKMALRYSAMLHQTALSQGDFANTINTGANQLRILHERVITLGRSIGSIFIPMIYACLPYLNAFISILIDVANAIAEFFGFEPANVQPIVRGMEDVGGAIDDIGGGLDDTTSKAGDTSKALKQIKNNLMGFDEINILPKDTPSADTGGGGGAGGGAGGGGIGKGIGDFKLPKLDDYYKGIKSKSDEIKQAIIDMFKSIGDSGLFDPLVNSLKYLWESAKPLLDTLGQGLLWLWDNVLVPIGKWTITDLLPAFFIMLGDALTLLNSCIKALEPLWLWFWEVVVKPLGIAIGNALVDGLKDLGNEMKDLAKIIDENQVAFQMLTVVVGGFFLAFEISKLFTFVNVAGECVIGLKGIAGAGKLASDAIGFFQLVMEYGFGATMYGLMPILTTVAGFIVSIGSIISGIVIFFKGLWDVLNETVPTLQTLLEVVGGIILVVIGVLLLPVETIVAVITGVVMGLVAIGTYVYKYWDEIKAWTIQTWDSITLFFSDFWNNLGKATSEMLTNIGNWFNEKWTEIKNFLFTTVPEILSSVVKWFEELPNKLAYALGFALGTVIKWGIDTAKWVKDEVPKIIDSIKKWWDELPAKIGKAIDGVKETIKTWKANVIKWFDEELPKILDNIKNWFGETGTKMWNGLIQAKDDVYAWFGSVGSWFSTEVPKIVTNIGNWFKDTGRKIKDALSWESLTSIGKYIVDGIFAGFSSLVNKAKSVAGSFTQGLKDALGIHSPSRVMRDEVGIFMGQGIAVGLDQSTDDIVGSANGIVDSVQGAFSDVSLIPTMGNMDFNTMSDFANASFNGSVNGTTTLKGDNSEFMSAMYKSVFDAVKSAINSADTEKEIVLQVGNNEFGRVAIDSINKITKQEGRLALNI